MSIRDDARAEAQRRWSDTGTDERALHTMIRHTAFEMGAIWASEADRPTSSNGKWVICGTDWVPEPVYRLLVGLQADREPVRQLQECSVCGERVPVSHATDEWEKRHGHADREPSDGEWRSRVARS